MPVVVVATLLAPARTAPVVAVLVDICLEMCPSASVPMSSPSAVVAPLVSGATLFLTASHQSVVGLVQTPRMLRLVAERVVAVVVVRAQVRAVQIPSGKDTRVVLLR